MMRRCLNAHVRLAEPCDLPQIAEFLVPLGGESFAERFPNATPRAFYDWKYFENPLGRAIVGVATVGGAVVSVVAATAKRIWLKGKAVASYEIGDLLTHAEFRKMGLASQLIELVCSEAAHRGASLIYACPNNASFPIFTGKLSFGATQWIDARRLAVPSNMLARKTGIPASLLRLSGMDHLLEHCCIPRLSSRTVTAVSAERFGEDVDQLWQQASLQYDFCLVRDSSYLNWRFSDCPTRYRIWLAYRNDATVGFLVAAAADEATPTATIVDVFTETNDIETAGILLATGIYDLLDSGVDSISTWTLQGSASSAAHKLLRRALPFCRVRPRPLVLKIMHSCEAILPMSSKTWHFTLGDSDGV